MKLIAVMLITTAIGNMGSWPFLIVWFHRPLLDRYAAHLYYDIPMPNARLTNQQIGLVYFSDVDVTPGGIYCTFPGGETVLKWDEDPPQFGRSLTGQWYLVYEPWNWWWLAWARGG